MRRAQGACASRRVAGREMRRDRARVPPVPAVEFHKEASAHAPPVKQCAPLHIRLDCVVNLIWAPAQLAVLAKVVDLNGFSAAARTLGVPKAAVSRAVADLEKALGVRVLERTTRRVSLTAVGRCSIRTRSASWKKSDAAHGLIAKFHAPGGGPLRVVADPTYGRVLLAPLVPRFLERFPDVPLDVALHTHRGASEEWDVAIRAGLPDDPTLGHRLLGALPAVLCATPAYLQQRGTPVEPGGLARHDFLTPETGHAGVPAGAGARLAARRGARRAEAHGERSGRAARGRPPPASASACCRNSCAARALPPPPEAGAGRLDGAARRVAVCRVSGHARRRSARAALRRFPRREHRSGARAHSTAALRSRRCIAHPSRTCASCWMSCWTYRACAARPDSPTTRRSWRNPC